MILTLQPWRTQFVNALCAVKKSDHFNIIFIAISAKKAIIINVPTALKMNTIKYAKVLTFVKNVCLKNYRSHSTDEPRDLSFHFYISSRSLHIMQSHSLLPLLQFTGIAGVMIIIVCALHIMSALLGLLLE